MAVPGVPAVPGYAPGSLVSARGREWVVLPEGSGDLLVARPLNGDNEFVTALFPDEVTSTSFPRPSTCPGAVGDHHAAALLRTALRLGFTAGTGPLRSLASIAVTPRQYQLVPLLLALRQETVRLLIADDVGIGKTIEAGLIAKELLAQGDARRLAVLCPAALAEQWQAELAEKFAIDATLMLSSNAARLEREAGYGSLFERHPMTVVSTDVFKLEQRRALFSRTCPDLVIVDEAHTCVRSIGGGQRQKRYELLRTIADHPTRDGRRRHLLLVTATPHSGEEETFRELLSLLDPRLAELNLDEHAGREELARFFVQRRRRDIRRYLDEDTPFPADRQVRDVGYHLTPAHAELNRRALALAREFASEFAREAARGGDREVTQRVRWWSALALLRAVASSPRAAAATLQARSVATAAQTAAEADELGQAGGLDLVEGEALEGLDAAPGAIDEMLPKGALERLSALATEALALEGSEHDAKLVAVVGEVKALLADGYDPIVFCRFLPTADYVGEQLAETLGGQATVGVVTGRLPPPERVARVDELTAAPGRHVLVATDCLAEGVSLQEHFQAVVHYDLAWNPTRHEQREGRVDRFGQRRSYVRAVTLYGEDNGIDGVVLDVLIRRHRTIARDTGVAVPVPERSGRVLHALVEGLLLRDDNPAQLALDLDVTHERDELHRAWASAAERESAALTKYAHSGVDVDDVRDVLASLRSALATSAEVRSFVRASLRAFGGVITPGRDGFTGGLTGLPPMVRDALGAADDLTEVVFHDDLPVPPGHRALIRTDPAVVGLGRAVLESALDDARRAGETPTPSLSGPPGLPAARCGVTRTAAVSTRTVLVLARYRFRLTLPGTAAPRTLIAEDARMLAYRSGATGREWLADEEIEALLCAAPDNVSPEVVAQQAERAVADLEDAQDELDAWGQELADLLRRAHERVRRDADARKGGLRVVPHDRADVLGVYVFLPALLPAILPAISPAISPTGEA
jgi:superfamily II DNA or RNA helicase